MNKASIIWVTQYRFAPINSPNEQFTGYVLGLMSDRESYQQAVETFLSTQNLSGHFQLAALPIQTWFTRHGFSAPLWRLAQQISPENPIILFRENALSVEAIAEDTEYLVQE